MTTQFVVGATPDTDKTIIGKTTDLYAAGGVHHAQFSAFRPIRETPMENVRATPAIREHRLYQADTCSAATATRATRSCSTAREICRSHTIRKSRGRSRSASSFRSRSRARIITRCCACRDSDRSSRSASCTERRTTAFRGLADLRRLGAVVSRAAGFLMLNGRRLGAERWIEQLALWTPEEDAGARVHAYEFSPGTFR